MPESNPATLLEPFGEITVLKGQDRENQPKELNGRETNRENRAYIRLAVNLDVSSMGASDCFD